MTTDTTEENENTVALYVKYKSEFENVILDTQNKEGTENPGRRCAKIDQNYTNFTTPCQEVGRYLIEIKEKYKSDRFKRCKYLKYRINSDNKYNKNPEWFQKYNEFSSQLGNICDEKFEEIQSNILNKLTELYSYYEDFNEYKGKDKDTSGNICNKIKNLYRLYNDNYKECQGNNESLFCKELNNFKKAYDDKMDKLSPCNDLPQTLPQIEQTSTQILPPTEVDYVFVPILTTSIVLLMSFTIFFLYKFSPLKSWIYTRLQRKKFIELNKFQEESSESLQNLNEEVNRSYEKSYHNITYQPQGDT
ncbi:PIR protein [Plasmodium malariae]|uniref:PIR protein n=1 Tax=Plasmodium malariae TaxID=5858 RepID=A0A1D3TDR3_PLAMA|nr:PIR protein [Plasmodium malariae]SCP03075.1 PIR protein [Plasmodium malariae]